MTNNITGLSKKEMEVISWLEFHQKYFFDSNDISQFTRNKTQKYNLIKNLARKKRIIKLARQKYYLIPIKAKSGSWTENPFFVANEIFNGKNYFIGGFAAAHYWKLTEQVPMQIDVFTNKRQGKKIFFNARFVFHRTTEKAINEKSVVKCIGKHCFAVLNKKEAKKWLKSRN